MRWGVALTAVLLLVAPSASADDPSSVANRVSQEVMSPFCDGLTVHDCPSQQSEELRFEILEMARAGMSSQEIVDELVTRYGERIRGVPEPTGVGLLVWVLPVVAVVAGAAVAFALARRFAGRTPAPLSGGGVGPSPEERARLDAELAAARERS
ncbi:MAG: cytochrome c-type biogenesis protein [Actinomycetota bacterium]